MNDFVEWYLQPFKKYAEFTGRARRKEYWSFTLGNFIISLLLGGAGFGIGLGSEYLGMLFSLFVFIPSLAVGVRRLHDTGKSGFWLLILFVPVIGFFVLLYFFLLDSDTGSNQYGPSPKALA
ncbi:MAG: DUF805 domain-containing protein [Balneolaceae bacterium]|nr:MAG: DUF805 domain-containing protein [Balneolaceae bacterium]